MDEDDDDEVELTMETAEAEEEEDDDEQPVLRMRVAVPASAASAAGAAVPTARALSPPPRSSKKSAPHVQVAQLSAEHLAALQRRPPSPLAERPSPERDLAAERRRGPIKIKFGGQRSSSASSSSFSAPNTGGYRNSGSRSGSNSSGGNIGNIGNIGSSTSGSLNSTGKRPAPGGSLSQPSKRPAGLGGNKSSSSINKSGGPTPGIDTIVIQPGSLSLLIGRASDTVPKRTAHAVAWRMTKKTGGSKGSRNNGSGSSSSGGSSAIDSQQRTSALAAAADEIRYTSNPGKGLKQRPVIEMSPVASFNKRSKPVHVRPHDDQTGFAWTDVSHKPKFVTGDAALTIRPNEPYELFWPIKAGRLNITPERSLRAVMADLRTIWVDQVEHHLGIKEKEFDSHDLGFCAAMCHVDSVCTTFGAGIASACVVNIGHSTTSVCCVEDGISLAFTRVRLDYGGNDIAKTFFHCMQMVQFPYQECSLAVHTDMLLIQELMQRLCHLNGDDYGISAHEFFSRDAAQGILYRYNVKVADQTILAPFGLFQPKIFGRPSIKAHTQTDKEVDPEDMVLGVESTGGEFQLMRTPSSLAIKADPFAGTSLSGGGTGGSGGAGGGGGGVGGVGRAYSGGAYSNGGFIGAALSDEAAAAAVAAHAAETVKMEAAANEAAAVAAAKATADATAHAAASVSIVNRGSSALVGSNTAAAATSGRVGDVGSASAGLSSADAEAVSAGTAALLGSGAVGGKAAPAVITTTSYMPSASGVIAAEVKTVVLSPTSSKHPNAASITRRLHRRPLTVKDAADKAAAEAKAAAQTQFLPGARMPAGMRESVSFVAVPTEQLKAKHAQLPLKGVDEVVTYSISKCSNDKTKKEMYKSILLVGGCALLPGLDRMLEKRLQGLAKGQPDINVLTKLRKMDPRNVPWRGATVIARLTSSQEMWVLKGDYEDFGVRRVRERAPFVW